MEAEEPNDETEEVDEADEDECVRECEFVDLLVWKVEGGWEGG